jgi:Caspase domain
MRTRKLRALHHWCAAAIVSLAMAGHRQAEAQFAPDVAPGVHAEQSAFSVSESRQYQEAAAEKDAQRRIVLLDAFAAKYPDSPFMPQVLNLYYRAYMEIKNNRKAFEYADKMLMLGAPLGTESRLQALYVRCKAFQDVFDSNAPDAIQQLTKNRYDALEAFSLIAKLPKTSDATVSDTEFLANKRNLASEMLDIAADADLKLQDVNSAEKEMKGALTNNPADGWADYSLGVLDLKKTPPQVSEGFWLLARAIPARPDAEASIRKYLRNLILAYQHSNCEVAAEDEMNQLIRQAAAAPERPVDFTIPNKLSPEQEQQCAPQGPIAAAPAATVKAVDVRPAMTAPGAGLRAEKASPVAAAPAAAVKAVNTPPAAAPRRGLTPEAPPKALEAGQPMGRYYALVIGINNYLYAPKLKTAVSDAQAVADVLRQQYGFDTRILTNATREQIIHALSDYRHTLNENANLLIYYAGHGVYDKDAEKTYWLPTDGETRDSSNWIIADEITTDIKVIPARHILIISDSCYSGGITRSVDLAFTPQERGRFLEKMMAGKSRTLMASGGLEPVSDEGSGGHSVFANALLRGLTAEDDTTFSAESLFEEFIRVSVAGQSEQTPQYTVIRNSGHDSGDFVFIRSLANSSSH